MRHEPNQTDTHFELKIWTRLEQLETDLDAYKTATEEGYLKLRTVEANLEIERQTLSNVSATINELRTVSHVEYVSVTDFINETRDIWANIEPHRAIIEEHTTTLTQLSTDWYFFTSMLQNQSLKITQVETDQTAVCSEMRLLSSRVIQLEEDLKYESIIIAKHDDSILANNDSLTKLQTDLAIHNQSIQEVTYRLTQLETNMDNMTEDRINPLLLETRMLQLEALLTAQNATLHLQDSKIQRLEINITDDQTRILLQGKQLLEVEASLNVQNATIQTHDSKINELELQGIFVKDTLYNHTERLALLKTDMYEANDNMVQLHADFIAQNTSIQEVTDRLAQLEMDITENQANIMIQESRLLQAESLLVAQNASLQTHASKLDELEAQGIANKYMLNNHADSLTELEINLAETDVNVKCTSTTNEAQTVQIVQLMFGFNNEYGRRLTYLRQINFFNYYHLDKFIFILRGRSIMLNAYFAFPTEFL